MFPSVVQRKWHVLQTKHWRIKNVWFLVTVSMPISWMALWSKMSWKVDNPVVRQPVLKSSTGFLTMREELEEDNKHLQTLIQRLDYSNQLRGWREIFFIFELGLRIATARPGPETHWNCTSRDIFRLVNYWESWRIEDIDKGLPQLQDGISSAPILHPWRRKSEYEVDGW